MTPAERVGSVDYILMSPRPDLTYDLSPALQAPTPTGVSRLSCLNRPLGFHPPHQNLLVYGFSNIGKWPHRPHSCLALKTGLPFTMMLLSPFLHTPHPRASRPGGSTSEQNPNSPLSTTATGTSLTRGNTVSTRHAGTSSSRPPGLACQPPAGFPPGPQASIVQPLVPPGSVSSFSHPVTSDSWPVPALDYSRVFLILPVPAVFFMGLFLTIVKGKACLLSPPPTQKHKNMSLSCSGQDPGVCPRLPSCECSAHAGGDEGSVVPSLRSTAEALTPSVMVFARGAFWS